jgi:hypothetical protein
MTTFQAYRQQSRQQYMRYLNGLHHLFHAHLRQCGHASFAEHFLLWMDLAYYYLSLSWWFLFLCRTTALHCFGRGLHALAHAIFPFLPCSDCMALYRLPLWALDMHAHLGHLRNKQKEDTVHHLAVPAQSMMVLSSTSYTTVDHTQTAAGNCQVLLMALHRTCSRMIQKRAAVDSREKQRS